MSGQGRHHPEVPAWPLPELPGGANAGPGAAELALARELATAIAHAPSEEAALHTALRRICETTGWALGQAWVPDAAGERLVCSPAWHSRVEGLGEFRRASENRGLPRGVGLPGRAWAARESVWSLAVSEDADFIRATAACEAGLAAGMAAPVLAGETVVAVIEFFVLERREEDSSFLDLVSAVAAQLGTLICQKQAEDALRASEAEFRAVAETASDAIVSASADGTITYVNSAARELFGYTAGDMVGHPLTLLIPERYRGEHGTGFSRYLRTREPRLIGRSVEVYALRKDGSELPVELSLATWQKDGSPFFTAIVRDTSERVRAQEALEQALRLEQAATERLKALDSHKGTLLHALSHDLRNPLAAILGLTIILAKEADGLIALPADRKAAILGNIAASARKMDRLLTDLVDFERMECATPHRRPTDLAALVRDAVLESNLTERHPVELDIESVVLAVEGSKVERIVENLLTNADRHLPAGTPIWVRLQPVDGGVLLSVEDAGPGVPEGSRSQIFEPFRRGIEATAGGLGLGLSLVARFAGMHGGRAWVDDRAGGGAAFRVYLPNGEDQPPDSRTNSRAEVSS